MELVTLVFGWILAHIVETVFGIVLTTLTGWGVARWRKRVAKRRAKERAAEAEQRAMDARVDRHNQLVDFLDQCPPEVQRVLGAFVHAKTHTLTLDPLDSAVAFLEHRGVVRRGPRVDGGGYIRLYYFTVEANFWRVMFDERGDNPADEADPS
jgi:type II secretory pathway pseudopilin PulG